MRNLVIVSVIIFIAVSAYGQDKPYIITKESFKPAKDSSISYPVFGKIKMSGDFGIYKGLELWVFDKNGKEVYFASHGIPATEAFADLVIVKMMDKGYIRIMTEHGTMLYRKNKEQKRPDW